MSRKKALAAVAWGALALAVILHEVLKRVLADTNVVGVLLASGGGASAGTLAAAALFVVTRIVSVLLLPGFLAYGLWAWAAERWWGEMRTPAQGPATADRQEGDGRRRGVVALVAVPLAFVFGWLVLRYGAGGLIGAARVLPGLGLPIRILVGLARMAVFGALPLLALYLLWSLGRAPAKRPEDDKRNKSDGGV